jgi:hypothetical protein
MKLFKLLFEIVLFICLFQTFGVAQIKNFPENMNHSIRSKLLERMSLVVQYQGENNWMELFDLSSDSIVENASIEKFVKQMSVYENLNSRIVDFAPKGISLVNDNNSDTEWLVDGCGKFKRKNKIVKVYSGLIAILHNNQWYFNTVSTLPNGVGGKEKKCTIK